MHYLYAFYYVLACRKWSSSPDFLWKYCLLITWLQNFLVNSDLHIWVHLLIDNLFIERQFFIWKHCLSLTLLYRTSWYQRLLFELTPIERLLRIWLSMKLLIDNFFHRRTELQIRKCKIVNIFQTHNWFVIVDANWVVMTWVTHKCDNGNSKADCEQ